MAWKLRQPFEGDRVITVSDVPDSAECWVDGSGNYIPSTIAVNISGTEYILTSVTSLDVGFLVFSVPSGAFITSTSTVQVYAICETDPESTTATLTAKGVNFQVTNGVLKACNSQVILNSDLDEYIKFYLTDGAGDFFSARWQNTPLALSAFSYQSGDTGNIAVNGTGVFSRPGTHGSAATLISNGVYGGETILSVTVLSTSKYFTARFGYIELIFDSGDLLYNNYMVASEFEVTSGTYALNDVFEIQANNSNYIVRKNGTVLFTKTKNIAYTVSGGTIVPSTSQVGIPVAWNVPSSAGLYTFTATLGDSIVFRKQVQLHSCADAVDNNYTGVYNTAFSGNVSTNDVACVGENTYYELASSPTPTGGTPIVNQNGTFTFTPTTNFNGAATFSYNIKCGSDFSTAEVVDTANVVVNYFNICNGVVANWIDTGNTRCGSGCTEEKEQRDTNAQCTGNINRWVSNVGGSACTLVPNLVPTGLKRCNNCVNEQEVQDLNSCSPTYLQKSYVADPTGNSCSVTPNWVSTGQFRCENCVEQLQQIDNASCSPTYNTTRWIANPQGTQCNRTGNWVDINEFVCVNCVDYKRQRDTNLCSPTYNQVRNEVFPQGTACSSDDNWVDTGITRCQAGVHQKLQTNTNPCAEELERWVNTGLAQCGCIRQIFFQNKCVEQGNIVGVTVYKQNVVESNRLVSYSNNVITFSAETGTFTYIINVIYSSGMIHKIIDQNYKCAPNI